MKEVEQAANEHDMTVKQLEKQFKDGHVIESVESFRHYASAWYELGYAVGRYEKSDSD